MAKMPELTVTIDVADLKVADVLAWLCRKAAEENRAHAEGRRDYACCGIKDRARDLPGLIMRLRKMRFDLTEGGGR